MIASESGSAGSWYASLYTQTGGERDKESGERKESEMSATEIEDGGCMCVCVACHVSM
jgi:hypothetical protein